MFRKLLLFLIQSNLLISFSAALITYATFNQLDAFINWNFILFVLFTTLFTYNFQRFIRLGLFKKAIPPVVNTHTLSRGWILFLLFASSVAIFWLVMRLPWRSIFLLLPAGLLSFLYAAPLFRYRSVHVALREVPYLKVHIIVLVWVWATVVAPWFSVFDAVDANFLLLCLERAALVMALTIPFDVRDLPHDYAFQKTVPQITGVKTAVAISTSLALVFGAVGYVRFYLGYLNLNELLAILITTGLAAGAVAATRSGRGEFFYTGILDSIIWVYGILMLLFSF